MVTMAGTGKRLAAYAHEEPWKEARDCFLLEQRLAWGVSMFRRLVEREGQLQREAIGKPTPALDAFFALTPLFYAAWVKASENHLARAEAFEGLGYAVDGIEEFRQTLEEAQTLVGLLECESDIPSMPQLMESLDSGAQATENSGV